MAQKWARVSGSRSQSSDGDRRTFWSVDRPVRNSLNGSISESSGSSIPVHMDEHRDSSNSFRSISTEYRGVGSAAISAPSICGAGQGNTESGQVLSNNITPLHQNFGLNDNKVVSSYDDLVGLNRANATRGPDGNSLYVREKSDLDDDFADFEAELAVRASVRPTTFANDIENKLYTL